MLSRFALPMPGGAQGAFRLGGEIRRFRDVGRWGSIFALLILLPAMLLAWIAWDSSRSVESSVDLELRLRADAAVRQVKVDLEGTFDQFEAKIAQRVANGETLLADLGNLSPHLRAAFRFDNAGQLVDPFASSAPARVAAISPRQRQVLDEAVRAGPQAAVGAWRRALVATGATPHANAEARLGLARALTRAGQPAAAEHELEDLYADYADLRHESGVRIGELALLLRAENRFEREPDIGATALMDLVEQISTARWELGQRDAPALVRRALTRLEGHADPEWLARQRSRLNERTSELWWASDLQDELEVLGETRVGLPDQLEYLSALADSPSLWAQLKHGDLYVFSFAVEDILREVSTQAGRIHQLDRDLRALVAESGVRPPDGALAVASLGPTLPTVTVYVVPADPDALARLKSARRTRQLLVVGLAVVLVGMGVVVSARIVGREVESARIKADFAANVSHELRSPITQIRLKAESLQLGLTTDADDAQRHYDAIVTSSERLSRLVDNVLDFAAIERGVKKYQFRPCDLAEIVCTAIEAARPEIAERETTLEVDLRDDLPALWLDREAIGQVVANLLSNALKYGGKGGWLRVSLRAIGSRVELAVADRGIGISRADQDKVFEHFFRSEDPAVRRMKGTGIGLTIVRYIVEAHGGMIGIESAPGQGSVFTVSLPATPPEHS